MWTRNFLKNGDGKQTPFSESPRTEKVPGIHDRKQYSPGPFWAGGILFAFMVTGLLNSTFLFLRAVYFHVLGNHIYWRDLYDQRSSPVIPRAVLNSSLWILDVSFWAFCDWRWCLGRELTEFLVLGTWKLWIPVDWFWAIWISGPDDWCWAERYSTLFK